MVEGTYDTRACTRISGGRHTGDAGPWRGKTPSHCGGRTLKYQGRKVRTGTHTARMIKFNITLYNYGCLITYTSANILIGLHSYTHTHTRAHAHTHARARAHTCTRTRTRTRTRIHTRTRTTTTTNKGKMVFSGIILSSATPSAHTPVTSLLVPLAAILSLVADQHTPTLPIHQHSQYTNTPNTPTLPPSVCAQPQHNMATLAFHVLCFPLDMVFRILNNKCDTITPTFPHPSHPLIPYPHPLYCYSTFLLALFLCHRPRLRFLLSITTTTTTTTATTTTTVLHNTVFSRCHVSSLSLYVYSSYILFKFSIFFHVLCPP